MLQVFESNMVLVLTEKDESLGKLLLTVLLRHFGGHDVQEVVVVDCYLTFLVSGIAILVSVCYIIVLITD